MVLELIETLDALLNAANVLDGAQRTEFALALLNGLLVQTELLDSARKSQLSFALNQWLEANHGTSKSEPPLN
jgi:hypothetical protein